MRIGVLEAIHGVGLKPSIMNSGNTLLLANIGKKQRMNFCS